MLTSKSKVQSPRSRVGGKLVFCLLLAAYCLFAVGCGVRFDMQDQPRYKYYKKSDFFPDNRASRDLPDGTVPRGQLHENKAFYTGKVDNPDPNAVATTTTDASGNTIITSFPNMIAKIPVPVTKELVDRGQDRFNIFCIVCHGALGNGDGMIVRRGFPKPPTYHDDRLRNAPDGHFFDVMTNGFGRMNSYADKLTPADRWAVVSYIRTLQAAQNPEQNLKMNTNTNAATPTAAQNANTRGGAQ
jgi:mono/diheme cytochrome c family protein